MVVLGTKPRFEACFKLEFAGFVDGGLSAGEAREYEVAADAFEECLE
jgi:hypothetical protein